MKQIISHFEKETKDLAKKISQNITQNVIILTGELGAGKTVFVQGFAKGLGIKDKIISPTFVLIRQHKIDSKKTLYHIDLYRLETIKELQSIGLKEICSNPNNIVLIEWGEKAKDLLPKNTIWIKFENLEGNKRRITVN